MKNEKLSKISKTETMEKSKLGMMVDVCGALSVWTFMEIGDGCWNFGNLYERSFLNIL